MTMLFSNSIKTMYVSKITKHQWAQTKTAKATNDKYNYLERLTFDYKAELSVIKYYVAQVQKLDQYLKETKILD